MYARPSSLSGSVMFDIIAGIVLAAVGSFAVAIAAHLNARFLSDFPWFLAGVALICLGALRLANFQRSAVPPRLAGSRAVSVSMLLAITLGAVAIFLSGFDSVLSGKSRLPGDVISGPEYLRDLISAGTFFAAAIIEEAAFRGRIQLRIQQHISAAGAEITADAAFILLHFTRFSNHGEALFVCLISVVGGRITTMTRGIRWPIVIHLGSNLIVLTAILWHRH